MIERVVSEYFAVASESAAKQFLVFHTIYSKHLPSIPVSNCFRQLMLPTLELTSIGFALTSSLLVYP